MTHEDLLKNLSVSLFIGLFIFKCGTPKRFDCFTEPCWYSVCNATFDVFDFQEYIRFWKSDIAQKELCFILGGGLQRERGNEGRRTT